MKNPKAHAFAVKLAQVTGNESLSIGDYEAALRMLVGAHLCATAPDLQYAQDFLAQLYAEIAARWNHPLRAFMREQIR